MSNCALYWRMLILSVRSQMQYRASFIFMSVAHFIATGVEAVAVLALFDRFGDLGDWTLGHVACFYGAVNVAFALVDTFARGFDLFGTRMVRTGDLDWLILRPRSVALQIASQDFPLFRVGRFVQGLVILIVGLTILDPELSIVKGCFLIFLLGGIFFFFYGLYILQATLSFWTIESLEAMNVLTYGGVETAQYPMAIYRESFQRFFTYVIPLGCVTYFPMVGFLGVDDPLGSGKLFQAISPTLGFLVFFVALAVWHLGLKHYQSTGT